MRMPARLPFGILAACCLANAVRAQDNVVSAVPVSPNLAYPAGSEVTFEWSYSCRNTRPCSFSCAGSGSANSVTALRIYLGTIPIGNGQKHPALIYFYSTTTVPRNDGFRISGGNQISLSCDVSGMTLDYSGPPK